MKNNIIFLFITLIINPAFCEDKSISKELVKWHESLDLAYPEEVDFSLQLQKTTLLEGEPLLLRCFIINKTAKNITIIPPQNRIRALNTYFLMVKILTPQNEESPYRIGFHVRSISLPGDEKIIGPYDSLYINAILWPNNFYDWDKRYQRAQRKIFPSGQYRLYCRISLGTKFYPKPARSLRLISDTVSFTINPIAPDEQNLLMAIDTLISAFFYDLEEILLVRDTLLLQSGFRKFDEIRERKSFMVPLIDFISIRSRASTDTSTIDLVITDARKFIAEHHGSILAEEMEFILADMLYRKEKKSATFVKEAKQIIAKYPKNINTFVLMDWLEITRPPRFDSCKRSLLH